MRDLLRKWTPREKYDKYQNFTTHFGLLLSLECSGEISRKSVESAYPINSLKVDVFLLESYERFSLVKVPKAWFPYRCICRICRVCRTKKIIGQIQLYGNLPYKCSIQQKRQTQLVVRDGVSSICPMNFFRTTDTTDTTDTTIWKPGLINSRHTWRLRRLIKPQTNGTTGPLSVCDNRSRFPGRSIALQRVSYLAQPSFFRLIYPRTFFCFRFFP